jgi:hypothetical protein
VAHETRARGIAESVIALAVGSSLTPWVPVPFVDDILHERLLRRIARKVLAGIGGEKVVAAAYLQAADPSFGAKAGTTLARFAIRKVAIVLDVKKSHDVFGEAIAFALALDSAVVAGKVTAHNGETIGRAIHAALRMVGAGLIDAMTRAGREALTGAKPHTRAAEAIGQHVDEAYAHLDRAMRHMLQ